MPERPIAFVFRTQLPTAEMGIFFAKKKHSSRVTEQDLSILQLKQARDKVKQYQRKIEGNLERERQLAKRLIQNGQKDRALLLLRKKRFQEQLLTKTDGQLENLERMVHDIEFAQVEIKVVDGLKIGNAALKTLNEVLSIDDIEDIMLETKEAVEKQNEISEMLSGVLTPEDETEVEAELDQLLADEAKEAMPEAPEEKLPEIQEELRENKKVRTKESTREAVAVTA